MFASISNRVNTFLLVLIALMGASIIAILATRASAGPLDPPGAPASTQANLIFQPASCASFPIVISQPGAYKLASDIAGCTGQDGIEIAASNVALDLAGHSVDGGGYASGSGNGIKNMGANGQLSISNGHVQQWGQDGIDLTGSSDSQVEHVVVTYNWQAGITIDSTSAVTNSTSSANGKNGISGAGIWVKGTDNRISSCQAEYNFGPGVYLSGESNLVEDCEVASNTYQGILGTNVERLLRNHVHHNGNSGINVNASAEIIGNGVQWNAGLGVECGDDCSVSGNDISSNTMTGLDVAGGVGVATDNHVFGNTGVGINVSSPAAGFPNVIARNVSTGNAGGNYSIGANNDPGPQTTANGATSPTTNVSQ
jgi:Right handed beta helix region